MKEDESKSKSRSTVRAATNEATFKQPSSNVTPMKRSGSSGSNAGSSTKDPLNTSATSSAQPQHLSQSPGVNQRMTDLSIENNGKRK
jgi:hypothetical protein